MMERGMDDAADKILDLLVETTPQSREWHVLTLLAAGRRHLRRACPPQAGSRPVQRHDEQGAA